MGGEKNGLRGWWWPAPGKGPRTVWPKVVPLPLTPSGGHKRKNSPGGQSFPGVFAKQRHTGSACGLCEFSDCGPDGLMPGSRGTRRGGLALYSVVLRGAFGRLALELSP